MKTLKQLMTITALSATISHGALANDTQNYFNNDDDAVMLKKALKNKAFLKSLNKQHAYFEGSQVVRRFFLCIPEASNFKFDMERIAKVEQCFNEIVDPSIRLDLNGSLSNGLDSTIYIATQGLAQLRQNASFSPTSFYISHYEEGDKPGTGRIELNFNVLVHQEIVESTDVQLPFDPLLGPQLFLSNNTLGVIASETGEWKIDLLKVRSLFTEQRPNINYQNPFPSYPID